MIFYNVPHFIHGLNDDDGWDDKKTKLDITELKIKMLFSTTLLSRLKNNCDNVK